MVVAEDPRRAGELGRVANACAGRVTLEQRDPVGGHPRAGVGLTQRARLPLGRRRQESARASVVRQTDAPNDTPDMVLSPHGVVQTFERHERRPFSRHQSIRLVVKRAAAAGRAQRAQRRKTDVDEQIIGAVDRAREDRVGPTIVQHVAS